MTPTTYSESADCQRRLAMKIMTMIVPFMFKGGTAIPKDRSGFHFKTLFPYPGRLLSTRLATVFRRTQKTRHGTAGLSLALTDHCLCYREPNSRLDYAAAT